MPYPSPGGPYPGLANEPELTDLQAAVIRDHPTCDDLLQSYPTCADFERAYSTTRGDTHGCVR
jgi:hypothetical protein